jgi:transcriptional regulator GlxA family with amidase domain
MQALRILFLIPPKVHGIDLFGPVQVFYEAADLGFPVSIRFAGSSQTISSAQGLALGNITLLHQVEPNSVDLVIAAGMDLRLIQSDTFRESIQPYANWLKGLPKKITLASICSGIFLLAEAGVLHNLECTTHWKCTDNLQKMYPTAKVLDNRLFVKDQHVYTSAGMTSGIDMSLYLLEAWYGPIVASKVAREMVVYLRRDAFQSQQSVYLDFRTHLHEGVHRVQDHLMYHPESKNTLEQLADIANMSTRNLTRVFRQATGISILEYKTRLRLELAENLMRNPSYTLAIIAEKCGFEDERQLRRIWKTNFGYAPSQQRVNYN